jgi:hypothetical protein
MVAIGSTEQIMPVPFSHEHVRAIVEELRALAERDVQCPLLRVPEVGCGASAASSLGHAVGGRRTGLGFARAGGDEYRRIIEDPLRWICETPRHRTVQ